MSNAARLGIPTTGDDGKVLVYDESEDEWVVTAQPAGIVVVEHGATAGTSRPVDAAAVYWVGSVEPTNAEDQDLWYDTDGTGAAGFPALLHTVDAQASISATSLATLDTVTIADNALVAGDVLHFYWFGDLLNNSGSGQTVQFAVLVDGGQVFSYTTSSMASNSTRRRWMFELNWNVRSAASHYLEAQGEVSNVNAVSSTMVTGAASAYGQQPSTVDFDTGPTDVVLQARLVTDATSSDVRVQGGRVVQYR